MKKKTRLAFALVIVLSVAVVAAMNKDALTATGQLNLYGTSSSNLGDPNTRFDTAVFSSGGLVLHDISGQQTMALGNYVIYTADGFTVVHDLVNNVWHFEWTVKNNLNVPITVQPSAKLYGCDRSRFGSNAPYDLAGASQGCPARGPSNNAGSSLTFAKPSAVDGTHDSTLVTMSFQVSTLNIASGSRSSTATNNEPIIATSAINQFLKLHPEAAKIRPAANPVLLRKAVCSVDAHIGTVFGKTTTLQPGQSATITSTVNSKDWGFACSPVNHALINYNVQAGGSTYQALKASELIVFGQEDANICGT